MMIECVRQFSMRHRHLLNLNSWRCICDFTKRGSAKIRFVERAKNRECLSCSRDGNCNSNTCRSRSTASKFALAQARPRLGISLCHACSFILYLVVSCQSVSRCLSLARFTVPCGRRLSWASQIWHSRYLTCCVLSVGWTL